MANAQLQLPGSRTATYVAGVVALSILGVVGIVMLVVVRPGEDHTQLITMMLGFLVPTVLGLLGAAVKEVHMAFNSRMTELLDLTAKSSRAEGELKGLTTPVPGDELARSIERQMQAAREAGRAEGIAEERRRRVYPGEL